jgi:hypothetical protein
MPHLSRTAVVGLLPGQARKIADEFPLSGLKFVPRDREREVPVLTADFDNVVVMTKFISHATWHQIPKEKLRPCNGGLTDLRKKLQKLHLQTKPITVAPKVVQRIEQETADVPETDYSAIKTAEPGTVLTFKRPPRVALVAFERQVMAARSYYKRHHHIETEHKVTDHGVEITVNGRLTPSIPVSAKPSSAAEVKKLWSESYLRFITVSPGASDEALARRADAAIAAYKERFEETP